MGTEQVVLTGWAHRKAESAFLAEEASAGGWEGLRAIRCGGEGKGGDEARKVSKP